MASEQPALLTWAPPWAPHVSGEWTPREVDSETGEIEPARLKLRCGKCGDERKLECRTGNVKGWINRFASVHYHADPMSPKVVARQAAAVKAARERAKG